MHALDYLMNVETCLIKQIEVGIKRFVDTSSEAIVENVAIFPADSEVLVSFQ